MESSRRKNEGRKGKTRKNLQVKVDGGSSNASNLHEKLHSFVRNGVINDESDKESCYSFYNMESKTSDVESNSNSNFGASSNLNLTKQCGEENGSEYDENIDTRLCKPCSVILERLSDDVVRNLLPRDNLGVKNAKKNERKTPKFHHVVINNYRRFPRLEKTRKGPGLKNRKSRISVESSSSSDKTIKSDVESNGSCSNERIDEPCPLLVEEKDNSDNSNTNEVLGEEPCTSTLRIEDLNEHESGVINPGKSERKLSRRKRFSLSRKKRKIAGKKKAANCRQDAGTEISPSDDLKELRDTVINSEPSKNAVSSQRRLKRVSEEDIPTTKEPDSSRQDHRKKTLRSGDQNEVEGSGISSGNSESVKLPQKRFRLSLRSKNTNSKDNEASGRDPTGIIPRREDFGETTESNDLEAKNPKLLAKRKMVDTEDDGSSAPKLNKFDEEQAETDPDGSKVEEPNPLQHESGASRLPDEQDTVQEPEVIDGKSRKRRVSSRSQNSVPIMKNIRVSLEKIKDIPTPGTSKQVDDVKLSLDRCVDTYIPDIDIQENNLCTKEQDLCKSPNKTRNTKITDYFFKIDKRSIFVENDKKNCDPGDEDLVLKKKFGISKDAVVSLIDLKKLKLSGSEYSESKIEKLSRECHNSSIENNSTIITTNRYQTTPPSNNFLCSSNELTTNDEKSSTDFENLLPVHDHVEGPSHDTLRTETVPMTMLLSLKQRKSPQVKNYSPTKSSIDPIIVEQSFTDLPNLLAVSQPVGERSPHSSHTHTVLTARNSPVKGYKIPEIKKYSPTKISRDPINDEQSSNDLPNLLLVCDNVHELSRDSLHPHTVPVAKNLSITGPESLQVKKHSPVKNTPDLLNENSFANSGPRLRSRKEKESLDSTKCSDGSSRAVENLNVYQEPAGTGQISELKKSSELTPRSRSVSANLRKVRKHSLDSMTSATPKSSKTFSPLTRKAVFSPEKLTVLINDEKESNASSKSPEASKVQDRNDAVKCAGDPEELRDGNELRKKPDDEPVLDKDLKVAVINQTNRHPVLVSVIQSPMTAGTPKHHGKQQTPRRLPVNSMTILSREMIEEKSSWIGLDIAIDDVDEASTTAAAKGDNVQKNDASENIPLENTGKDKTRRSSTTAKNVENNCSENNNPVNVLVNEEDAKSRAEPRDSDTFLIKLLTSESAESLSPKRSAVRDIESCLSEENELAVSRIVQKKLDDVESSDPVSEKEESALKVPDSIPVQPVEDSSGPIAAERDDEAAEKSNSQDQLKADSQEDAQLLIDIDESESDPRPIEDVTPGTSSTGGTIIQGEETGEDTKGSRVECVICKKTFRHARGLEQHLRVHVRRTDGSCLICDKPITKKNVVEHYLEHCGCFEDSQNNIYPCGNCKMKFSKKSSLINHMKGRHNVGKHRVRAKLNSANLNHNKCDVCQLICDTEEDLHSHVFKHTEQELQDAFKAAMAKKIQGGDGATVSQNQGKDPPEKEKTQGEEQLASEVPDATNTSPKSPSSIPNMEVFVCTCHKDERLEISGGVIIEIALACVQCKTFFKSKKCFKDHYNSTSCKWGNDTPAVPKMFCNKCCVILNNLEDLHSHLAKHAGVDAEMKTSLLCKHCNIFFFSIGSLFYAHWTNHRNNPLYTADHYSFPKKMKVKIVEPGGLESAHEDEPTESLFIADHLCQNCEKPFQTENELKKHLNSPESCTEKIESAPKTTENPKSAFNLICSICNKEFVDKSTFDVHIEEHDTIKGFLRRPKEFDESLGNNQLTCTICKTKYDTVSNYKEHLIRHEVIQEKFVCNYCDLMMDSVEDFKRHSAEHKGTPEKPVACKVIFATAKFHCKPCKIWFDSQSILDEHVTAHLAARNPLHNSSQRLLENSTTTIALAIEKKSHVCATCQQEFDDQIKLDAHVSTHDKDSSEPSIADPVVIHLSDDSNSTDIEIIGIATSEESEEPVAENTLVQEQQETVTVQETKKPPFLRVKNLKELLPYACSKCKAEFDTQVNLSKHVCTPHVKPTKDKEFNYSCTVCKNFTCKTDSDWNRHVLSHLPLYSSQKFNEEWFRMMKLRSGQQVFKCNRCPNFESLTVHTMRQHFLSNHRDIYHPIFECRVCRSFKTDMEHEIRRHEAAHFQSSSPFRQLAVLSNHSSTAQPTELPNNLQQPRSISSLISSGNNTSMNQPENVNNSQKPDNPNNFSRPGLNPSVIRSSNSLSSHQSLPIFTNSQQQNPSLQDNNTKNFQQSVSNLPATNSGKNSPLFRPLQNVNNFMHPTPMRKQDNNSNNFQQAILLPATSLGTSFTTLRIVDNCIKQFQRPIAIPVVTNLFEPLQNFDNSQKREPTRKSDNNSKDFQQSNSVPPVTNSSGKPSTLETADGSNTVQHTLWIPPAASSSNNLPSLQPSQISNTQPVSTLPPNGNCNSFQQSISIPSVTISGNNLSSIQQVDISNKFQQSVSTPAVTSAGNNLPAVQPLQSFNNSQQTGSTVQPYNNSNNFQQSITIPPVTSSGSSSLSSVQSMDNSQWSTASAQTFQIQINNGAPFNNMTNMMHTVPMYVTNVTYCCRICKTFKCSSEQELKVHESLHEFIQLTEPSKRLFRCKVCTNIFCPTEEHLKSHMDAYHKSEKSNVSQNQTQSNVSDNQIKCKLCPQTFSSSAQLTRHMYASHTFLDQKLNDTQFRNSYPFTCELCQVGFLNEAFLQAHIRQIHPGVKLGRQKDANTLYQCNTCGLLLISEATLNYHMRSHNGGLQQ